MSSGDETILEAFIESISTLPYEIRRNLELMKVLDQSCSTITDQLQTAQDEYVQRAEETILNLPLPNQHQQNDDTTASSSSVVIPTTEELMSLIEEPETMEQIKNYRDEARKQSDEKVAVAEQTYDIVDDALKRLDRDLAHFEALLKRSGEFESITGAKPNDLAAIQVNPNSADWILAKVISYDSETGMYKLSDEDVESDKIFHLPEPQVIILGEIERLSRGDIIYAVYPDTTSFYQATVVQAPRKVSGGGSFVLVNFQDDSDENGVTHDKAVLMKHVMRVPYRIS